MGGLAVPQVATLAEQENIECLEDLTKIATPEATKALVDFLWHANGALSYSAAWNLAELFTQANITETIQEFELTAEQKKAEYIDWIWQPFNDSLSQSLRIIAGRIVYLLDKTPIESIPRPLPQIDPRLAVPLLSIHKPVNFPSNNRWNSESYLLQQLVRQEQTPELEIKFAEQVNHILRVNLSSSRWGIILSSLKLRLRLALLNRLINHRNDWRNLLLKMDYDFQHSYHYRLVLAVGLIVSVVAIAEIILLVSRQPDNWLNGLLGLAIYIILVFWMIMWEAIEERLEPNTNTFIKLGLLGLLNFVAAIQRLFKERLVWGGIMSFYKYFASVSSQAFLIAFTAVISVAVAATGAVTGTFAVAFGVIAGASAGVIASAIAGAVVAIVGAIIGAIIGAAASSAGAIAGTLIGMGYGIWDQANSARNSILFLAIFAFPYFCWFPIVVVFSTLFMLRYLTWQYTALIWIIVLGTCTALWLYGQDRHRKASNPLKGILDVAK